MGIGTAVILIAAGAILSRAVDVDLPYVDDDALGLILIVAGVATLVISVVTKVDRPEAGIGTGVFLVGAGAVLAWAIDFDLPYIADYVFGTILIVAGLIAVAATLLVGLQRKHPSRAAQNSHYANSHHAGDYNGHGRW